MNCGQRARALAPIWGLWQLMKSVILLALDTHNTTAHWWDPYTTDTALTSSYIQMTYKGFRLYTVIIEYYYTGIWILFEVLFMQRAVVSLFRKAREESSIQKCTEASATRSYPRSLQNLSGCSYVRYRGSDTVRLKHGLEHEHGFCMLLKKTLSTLPPSGRCFYRYFSSCAV